MSFTLQELEKLSDDLARDAKRQDIQQQFNLWPFTARVICIAMLNGDTSRGQVLFTGEDFGIEAEAEAKGNTQGE